MMAIHPGLSKMTCPDAPIRVTSACLHIVNVPIRHTSPDIRYPSVREVNETPLYPSSHTNLDKYGCRVKNHIKGEWDSPRDHLVLHSGPTSSACYLY